MIFFNSIFRTSFLYNTNTKNIFYSKSTIEIGKNTIKYVKYNEMHIYTIQMKQCLNAYALYFERMQSNNFRKDRSAFNFMHLVKMFSEALKHVLVSLHNLFSTILE